MRVALVGCVQLRGMKFSAFDGGTRVASFVSGGALPPARRGKTEKGLVHICDWLGTFAALAGAKAFDYKAYANGLPPVDRSVRKSQSCATARTLVDMLDCAATTTGQ